MNQQLQHMPLQTIPLEGDLLPFSAQSVTMSKREYIELLWLGRYWKVQHARSCERELVLKAELQQKEAMIRDLNQRIYGKKSEKGGKTPDINPSVLPVEPLKRGRGQQRGSAGHGRTKRPNLQIVDEVIVLSERVCDQCGSKYSPLPDEESSIIEIKVSAYTRRIRRQQCSKNCACTSKSKIITAPIPYKLIAKSPYGASIWEHVLRNKFLYGQPINRILKDLDSLGLTIAAGTIAGNLKKISPLFEPLRQAFYDRQMTETKFHNDETRWEVYEPIDGKVGHRWYLWVTRSASVIYYCIDPTRSADVPIKHFANLRSLFVILICDRYSAYKKLARLNLAILLAFCWAHVRRDFLDLARAHIDMNGWGLDWAAEISTLFHLNKERIKHWDPALPLAEQSTLFQEKHQILGSELNAMKVRCDSLLTADKLATENYKKGIKTSGKLETAKRKVLSSLKKHWKGLMVFYHHPDVSMDNNPAEQSIRNPVLGRKGYYGSGSLWSAELAAIMFTIFQTLLLWKLNPRTWLELYLEACAKNNGKTPHDLSEFLPWTMNLERLKRLTKPPQENSS